ncbi:MAG: hypothetical protein ACKOWX_07505 [Flavobacteriales bacterium]
MPLIYLPTTIYVLLLGLRHGNLFLLSLANPKTILGGFVLDSKYEQHKRIPQRWQLRTLKIIPSSTLPFELLGAKLQFPCFVKPDIGEGGNGVFEIKEIEELTDYHQSAKVPYLIQEKAEHAKEYSLLCYRTTAHLKVRSITKRDALCIKGDGSKTIEQHIQQLPFSRSKRRRIARVCEVGLDIIPAQQEYVQINYLGNYDFGASYTECQKLASKELYKALSSIFCALDNYNIARLDVKATTWEALQSGDFKVLEVNGLNGEPIHIYDPKYSFFSAQKEIFKHWQQVYLQSKFATPTREQRTSLREAITFFRQHLNLTKHAKN